MRHQTSAHAPGAGAVRGLARSTLDRFAGTFPDRYHHREPSEILGDLFPAASLIAGGGLIAGGSLIGGAGFIGAGSLVAAAGVRGPMVPVA